jgi:hypothetical protein
MALKLLAGPFPLQFWDGTALTSSVINFGPHMLTYVPKFGFVFASGCYPVSGAISSSYFGVGRLSIDGYCYPLGMTYDGCWLTDAVNGIFRAATTSSVVYQYELIGFTSTTCTPAYTLGISNGHSNYSAVDLPTGRYMWDVPNLQWQDTYGVTRTVYTGKINSSDSCNVCMGRTSTEVLISNRNYTGDGFAFFDTTSQTLSQTYHLGTANSVASMAYDSDHGVLLSVEKVSTTSYVVNVWSLDVEPSSVSAVTLQSGSTKQGATAVYQVTVLGASGEYCEDEVVSWSISGAGTLLSTTSSTNSKGVATVSVLNGLSDGTSSVVTATVNV